MSLKEKSLTAVKIKNDENIYYICDITKIIDDNINDGTDGKTMMQIDDINSGFGFKIFRFKLIRAGDHIGNAVFVRNKLKSMFIKDDVTTDTLNTIFTNFIKCDNHYTFNEFNKIELTYNMQKHGAKPEIARFIADFVYCVSRNSTEIKILYGTYMNGYCYYFACMLKEAFNRGEICWCAPYGHFVWMDDDGIPYDIYGVNKDDCDYYIPVTYIGDGINDFKHVIGKDFNADEDFIKSCIEKYRKDKGL